MLLTNTYSSIHLYIDVNFIYYRAIRPIQQIITIIFFYCYYVIVVFFHTRNRKYSLVCVVAAFGSIK